MEDNKDDFKKVSIKLDLRRSQDFQLYFTNNVQVSAGQTTEVQIFFGQIISPIIGQAEMPDSVRVEQGVGVVMTLAEFRKMLEVFNGHLPKLEKIASLQSSSSDE